MMPVGYPRGEASRHPWAEHLLSRVGDQRDLALEDVDELVLVRVPVAERRARAGLEPGQVDPEVGEAEQGADRALAAGPEAGAGRFRVPPARPPRAAGRGPAREAMDGEAPP